VISDSRRSELRGLVSAVTKDLKLAPGDLVLGEDIPHTRPRTSTGILSLDVALGGGLPLNQWTEIVGPFSSGKTTTAMKIIAHQQRMYPDWICLWVAAEGFEAEFALMNGVDVDRLILVETNSMEEVFETVIKTFESRLIDGVVIDSFPALVPTGEYERDWQEGSLPALGARLFNQFFRKVQKASRRSLVEEDRTWLGIVINQWRDQIGVMFGDKRTTPGGKGKDYSYYVRLDVAREALIDNGETGKHKKVVGQEIRVKVIKNKSGPPQRFAYYTFYVDDHGGFKAGEIDVVFDVFSTAEALGIVARQESGNSYYFLGEKIAGNKPATLKALEESMELTERVQEAVYDMIGKRRKKRRLVRGSPAVGE
jgi:recombination protein RecA